MLCSPDSKTPVPAAIRHAGRFNFRLLPNRHISVLQEFTYIGCSMSNPLNKVLFPRVTWFLFLLIPITFYGFYPTYFSILISKLPSIVHLHAFFMVLWIGLAIWQPILIRQRKTKLHKHVGKLSYFIMPLVFATTYLMIRHIYYRQIDRALMEADVLRTPGRAQAMAADYIIIGVIYLAWLVTFYTLAVIRKKKMSQHASYMFAAVLTLLGPTVDRSIGITLNHFGLPYNIIAEYAVFTFILVLLTALIFYQKRKGISPRASVISLFIYLAGILLYRFLPGTSLWHKSMDLVL